MTKTIVILGAGLAGLPVAHYLLRKTSKKHPDIRVVLVSPHDTFYWKLASVRFAIPGQMAEEKYMYPLAEQFTQYGSDKNKFELIIGSASTLDPSNNTVSVRVGGSDSNEVRSIAYHTIVIATGSRYADGQPWKESGTTAQTRAALSTLGENIQSAKSIVVVGAGLTGVEFAGELGSEYGSKAPKSTRKEITIVGSDALPLEKRLKDNVRQTAVRELEKLGVKYIGGAKVIIPPKDNNQTETKTVTLTRSDGTTQTLSADLIIPTFGVIPNTSFAPTPMLDPSTQLFLVGPDLRAPGHNNIFIVGDCGNLQPAQAANADAQVRHLMTQFDSYLSTSSSGGKVAAYKYDANAIGVALTIGRDRATGQVGNWQVWSLLIWYLKGRHLGTDSAGAYARGDSGALGKAWPK